MLVTLLAARLRKLVALLLDSNAKIQNGRAFCKKSREYLPTILRSENFALKVAKPFVLGHFRQERKRSEIGRKIFEKYPYFIDKHQKRSFLRFLTNSTFRQFDFSTIRQFDNSTKRVFWRCAREMTGEKTMRRDKNICIYIFYIIYIL